MKMDFKSDHFMYGLAIFIMVFVLADSLFFLIRAWKRGKELGLSTETMKATVTQSALFSIPPAISIVATVLTLSAALGIVLPWIRLSIIGSISYEVPAAESAIDALGYSGGLSHNITSKLGFSTIAWVMTAGSILPLIITPIFSKKIQSSVGKAVTKNSALANVLSAAAFIGLIAAFAGKAIVGVGDSAVLGDGAGILSVSALLMSMLIMWILTKINNKKPNQWLEALSMPIAMICAMLFVMLLANVLPHDIAWLEWRG